MGNSKGRTNAPCGDLQTRLLRRIKFIAATGCWEWQLSKNKKGYGQIASRSGKMRSAHRVSYEIYKGEIPSGMLVCHSCDNPACVNPEHLWLGTNSQNIKDSFDKGRSNNQGENQPSSKIKNEDVLEIRKLRKEKIPYKEIAKMFNIHMSNVYYIVTRKTWAHLPEEGGLR